MRIHSRTTSAASDRNMRIVSECLSTNCERALDNTGLHGTEFALGKRFPDENLFKTIVLLCELLQGPIDDFFSIFILSPVHHDR